MIKIKVNNEYLDLGEEFSIRIKRKHPAFVRDSLGREYSYPVSIPFTPTNQRVFGFKNLQDTPTADRVFNQVQLIIGASSQTGNLYIHSTNNDSYDCHLKIRQGTLDDDLKDLKLLDALPSQLYVGTTPEEVASYAKSTLSTESDSPYIFFPIRTPDFYSDHDYFGSKKFGSRCLLLWTETAHSNSAGMSLYINQRNIITGEVLKYRFEYTGNSSLIDDENEYLPAHNNIQVTDLAAYIKTLQEAFRDKRYLKNWTFSTSQNVGLPLDKYQPYEDYQGLVIELTDTEWVFENGVIAPLFNYPEAHFFTRNSINQTVNHYGYMGDAEFTIDGWKENTNLLRSAIPFGVDFWHVGFTLAPQIRIKYLLKNIFASLGYALDGFLLKEKEFQDLMLFCNYALDEIEEEKVFETLHSYLTIARPDEDPETPGIQVEMEYKFNRLRKIIHAEHVSPDVKQKDFLLALLNFLGLWLDYDERSNTFFIRSHNELLDTRDITDWTLRAGISFGKTFEEVPPIKKIEGNYDDADDYEDFGELDSNLSIYEIDSRHKFQPVLNPHPAYYYVHAENAYYYNSGTRLIFVKYKTDAIQLLDEEEEGEDIDFDITETYMYEGDDGCNPAYNYYRVVQYFPPGYPDSPAWAFNYAMDAEATFRAWRVPYTADKGSSLEWNQKVNKPKLKLMFYRGMHKDDSDLWLYPLASSDIVRYGGEKIATQSLQLHGKYGRYENLLRRWVEFINNSEVHLFDKQMQPWEILNLPWFQKIRVGNQLYIMYEYDVLLKNDGTIQCQQKMIKL